MEIKIYKKQLETLRQNLQKEYDKKSEAEESIFTIKQLMKKIRIKIDELYSQSKA